MPRAPKKKSQARTRRAPVRLTGGSGHRQDNEVAARFLLDMLASSNRLGIEFGRIVRIDWQARDVGWLVDDLALTCEPAPGENRFVGISVKSDQQVTTSGFPEDFVDLAWGMWLGRGTSRTFRRGVDAIVLAAAGIPNKIQADWSALLREILNGSSERIVSRLASSSAEGAQASQLQRALFESFTCPTRYTYFSAQTETVSLLHDVRLLNFDFNNPSSQDLGRALVDCQSVLISGDPGEARDLWNRLVGIADEKRPVGGFLGLRELLSTLRDKFNFRDHPDFRADWEALLRRSRESLEDVEATIASTAHLPRTTELATVKARLLSAGACVLAGESGSGKSALLKEIAHTEYPRTIWLQASTLDVDSPSDVERTIGLRHSLVEILRLAPERCLVVFDSIEGYTDRAMRITARITNELIKSGATHVHLAFSVQFHGAERKIATLNALGMSADLLQVTPLGSPSDDEIQQLIQGFPSLRWVAIRPELRPLLTNLKVLDWFARSDASGWSGEARQLLTLTAVIDRLWGLWTEGPADGHARSHLLMSLATAEADTLSRGLPRTQLGHTEQAILTALQHSGLIRIREDRVFLAHDLLGDWARLRVLVAEDSTAFSNTEARAASPKWQQAVRLFGQRLLEISPDGKARWQHVVDATTDSSPSLGLMRDLFLDALVLATNSVELLEDNWATLTANSAKLLNRLLDRFLIVATLPDPRPAILSGDQEEGKRLEHLFRLPYWPYWGPLLSVLHARRSDVVRFAPYTAARLCALWLRVMPADFAPTWQRQAAELALEIAREIQARNAEGSYFSDREDRSVYEAALYAALHFPELVADLCLELAGRKDLSPGIAMRVQEARRQRDVERAQTQPSRAPRPPAFFSLSSSRRRPPWPDGPRRKVDHNFREACLSGIAFSALTKAAPQAALEVLLAICIEEPPHDDVYGGSSLPECGLSFWREGEPAAYFRGPFLQFFREAPDHALSFVIKLTNFGTRRYTRDRVWLDMMINGQRKRWYGDSNVYRWHHDWPLPHGSQLQSSLMALEQWLYEQIERGATIDTWIRRILGESESLAFAGVLMEIGKRLPELFAGVLRSLFFSWELWNWDFQLATLRRADRQLPGYWGRQPAQFIEAARTWYRLPHRSAALLALEGPIAQALLGQEQLSPLFEEFRSCWKDQLQGDEPNHLRLLIERLDPKNYTFEQRGNELVPVDFNWPEAIAQENAEAVRKLAQQQTLTQLPWRCREFLNKGTPLPPDQCQWLWDFLQTIDVSPPELPSDDGDPLLHIQGVFCAGIALLLSTNRQWIQVDESRLAWCRAKLKETVDHPPPARKFDSEISIGDAHWDSFAAEAGVLLLGEDQHDPLARRLVAAAVTAFNYNTTALAIRRAASVRAELGDDFARIIAFAIHWSALRPLRVRDSEEPLAAERASFDERKRTLISAFVDESLPAVLPDLSDINTATRTALDEIHEKRFPGSAARRVRSSRGRTRSRETLHPEHLGLDTYVLRAAFGWLDVRNSHTFEERGMWLAIAKSLFAVVLDTIPVVEAGLRQEIDGLPTDFDSWVFKLLARTIPLLTAAEQPESFWRPLLARGAPAHQWIEYFFWEWFTDGFAMSPSPAEFVSIWRSMIMYALTDVAWDPATAVGHELDAAVLELLCLDVRWNAIVRTDDNAALVGSLESIFERAIGRWGVFPKIINGLAVFAAQPGSARLLLPALRWVSSAVRKFDTYDWKYGLEDNVIDFLHTCWQRESAQIMRDSTLKESFLAVLTILVSRGGHAAINLNNRVSGSLNE
jgi:alpha-D-ribose 1-methylphosphonate 5-triphosphate synthase subunit PhnL